MHMVDIPFFKEVLIMATACDRCGYRSNEVKSGTEIPEKGKILKLQLSGLEDLSRDILKSASCTLEIPEIGLKLQTGTLGARFTTVEGLLLQVYNELNDKCQFVRGDSADKDARLTFERLLEDLQKVQRFIHVRSAEGKSGAR